LKYGLPMTVVFSVDPSAFDLLSLLGRPTLGIYGAQYEGVPPVERLDISTPKKLLTIGDTEPALRGYRCFLAITDRIREEKGDFFLQPHRTSIVWGGQKALFIFEHHSGEFGLYYDLQTQGLISS